MCVYCETFGGDVIWYLNPRAHRWRMHRLRERIDPNATITKVTPGLVDWESIRDIIPLKETDPAAYQEKIEWFSEHFSAMSKLQVVPLQDAMKVVEVSGLPSSLMCMCRFIYRGILPKSEDEFYCGGIGTSMLRWERWPERYKVDPAMGKPASVKLMSVDEAKDWLRDIDKKGLVHCVGHEVGYVNMLCNCNYPECMIMRLRIDYGVKGAVLKSHYVALVDWEKCNGCHRCIHRCYFGALRFNPLHDRAEIDAHSCFGCGLCETECPRDAIRLERRELFPGLRDEW